jgi:tetratricopeptide (TPR) repeat protein
MRAPSLLLWVLVPAFSAQAAMGVFEKNDPRVQAGMEAEDKGDYETALQQFEAAQKDFPSSAQLDFNRGHALHKLGRNEEAKQALDKALERDNGELANKIHFNMGNVLTALDKKREAVAEYRQALRVKPNDNLARHNMEVLLKNLPPPPPPTPDGGTPGDGGQGDGGRNDAGQPDGGRDGGSDGGSDGGHRDGGGGDGGSSADGGAGDGGAGDGGAPKNDPQGKDGGAQDKASADGGRSDAGAEEGDGGVEDSAAMEESRDGGTRMSKKEAERLLDSMKNSEKNLQLWRFQKKKTRPTDGKDW